MNTPSRRCSENLSKKTGRGMKRHGFGVTIQVVCKNNSISKDSFYGKGVKTWFWWQLTYWANFCRNTTIIIYSQNGYYEKQISDEYHCEFLKCPIFSSRAFLNFVSIVAQYKLRCKPNLDTWQIQRPWRLRLSTNKDLYWAHWQSDYTQYREHYGRVLQEPRKIGYHNRNTCDVFLLGEK